MSDLGLNLYSRFMAIVAIITIAMALPVSAHEPAKPADSWPSFRNNPQLTGIASTKLPAKLSLKWKLTTKDGVPATAAIVDGHAYIPILDGEVWCIDIATGKKVWTYQSRPEVPTNGFLPGFKSSPLVTKSIIVVGDEEGLIHGINRETGKQVWTFETSGEIVSSATLAPIKPDQPQRIVIGSYDNSLYCLDLETGKKIWAFASEGYVNCTPAIAVDLTFVAGCDEDFRVIDLNTGEQKNVLPLKSYLIGSPAVIDETVYIGTYAGELISLNWKTLERNWTYKLDDSRPYEIHSSAAATDKFILIGGQDKKLHCVDRATGKMIWTLTTKGHVDSSPVVVENRVFVGSKDGSLYEVDLPTGNVLSKNFIGRNTTASPAIAESVLIIGSANAGGEIHCYGEAK